MTEGEKEQWDSLVRMAARAIGPEVAAGLIDKSTDRGDLMESLLFEVLVRAADGRRQQISRFEFQMKRSERLAAIGQMAAGIAHEVNNPLGALSGFIQLMVAEYPEKEKGLELLDEMSGEVRRIRSTLDRLLDFSRHSVGAMEARRARLDVAALVAETIELVGPQIHFSRIRTTAEIPEGPCEVIGNADELKQVFMNILLNAVQAMPTGGDLKVSVFADRATEEDVPPQSAPRRESDPPEASFYHLRRADGGPEAVPLWEPGDPVIRARISDTGVGIRPEQIDMIFEPFFTTKGRGEGTGLGLSTSLGIVSSHGGDLRVESALGEGAAFTVTLPSVSSGAKETAGDEACDG